MSAFDAFMTETDRKLSAMEDKIRSLPRPDGMPRGMYLNGGPLEGQITPEDDSETAPEDVEFWAAMEWEEQERRAWAEDRAERL